MLVNKINKIKNILWYVIVNNKKDSDNGMLTAAKPESIAAGPLLSNLRSFINISIQVDTLIK